MYAKDQIKFGFNALVWLIVVVLVIGGLTFGWLVAWPYYNNLHNAGIRSGYEYTGTKNEVLYSLMASWQELDTKIQETPTDRNSLISSYRAQQRGIIKKMDAEIKMLTPNVRPPDITAFINAHKGE